MLSDRFRCRASCGTTSTSTAPAMSEDCLYLNVWTPAAPGTSARLPVMVWIHGGGFVVGSGAEPRYDGARLAARGIVVVTVNHRLNALGFLAHPELTAEFGSSRVRRLRLSRPCRRAQMGQAQHRRFRRRSRQGHDRRRIRRLPCGERADGLAARQGTVRARHRRERGDVRLAELARRRRSRRPRPRASISCARSERIRWPNCAPLQPTRSSPPRRGSAFGRSSTDGFCRARRPRSSPPASRATCR